MGPLEPKYKTSVNNEVVTASISRPKARVL